MLFTIPVLILAMIIVPQAPFSIPVFVGLMVFQLVLNRGR